MSHQDDFSAAETPAEQPAMELLEGAEAAPPSRPSPWTRVARGSLYGVLLLSATTLLAVSAVPELSTYLSFLPGDQVQSQGSCALSSGACTSLSAVSMENAQGSPCCPLQATMAAASGQCSSSSASCASLASVSADLPACCLEDSACSAGEGGCTLAAATDEQAPDEQPLDEEALAKLPVGEDLDPVQD